MNDALETRWSRVLRVAILAWALLPLLAVAEPEGDAPQPTSPGVATPSSTNTGEAGAPSVTTATAEPRTWRDRLNVALGLNIGVLPGVELRVLGITDVGFMVGASLRAGTFILASDAGWQAIVGWEFQQAHGRVRPYLTFGAAKYVVFPILGSTEQGTEYKAGLGCEWKVSKSFGLGFSGGFGSTYSLWGGLDLLFHLL